ncbi:MAG: hypothetical protein RIC11_08540 [Botrimarina sp.]
MAGGRRRDTRRDDRTERERRRGVWQPRFWEHTIEDDEDFERHFDYVHYNPVKHGLVACPGEWPASSFQSWVRRGVYPQQWGCGPASSALEQRLTGMDATTGE